MRVYFAFAALVLAGCGSAERLETASIDRFVAQQTLFVADEVDDARRYQGALAAYATDVVRVSGPGDPKLEALVNARWNGTLEDLTKTLARHLGYRTTAAGEKLPSPTFVVIQTDELTALGMLRQAFEQARGRARLTIDTAARALRVTYVRPEASPVPHQDDLQL